MAAVAFTAENVEQAVLQFYQSISTQVNRGTFLPNKISLTSFLHKFYHIKVKEQSQLCLQ